MNKGKLIIFLLFLFLGVNSALAQSTITGKVTGDDGMPVPGATIVIKGTTLGTIAGADGTYKLSVPQGAKADSIQFSFIGMETVVEAIAGRTTINSQLKRGDVAVDEVVVTALGISRDQKTLGYAATKVSSDDIVGARTTNVADALAGKVAGLQVNSTSSNPGAASNVVIRGFSSINGSNQPLYVVDGIPMTNGSVSGNGITLATSGISNISSNDIESMTVLKGAAATALYGSRAANGVILITTKSGKKTGDKNFTVEYNGTVQARMVSLYPEMQNDFGQGWNGAQTYIENGSWGPRFDGSMQLYGPIYNGQQLYHKYVALEDNIDDFLETGWSQNHSVSLNGVSDDNKMKYYVSYSFNGDNGIMPGDHDVYKRNTITFKSTYDATSKLSITSSINFSRISTDGVDSDQGVTAIDGLLELPRDVSLVDMKDLSNVFNTPTAYFTPYGITNPYWAIENSEVSVNAKEVMGKIQADYKIIEPLKITYRFSFNHTDRNFLYGSPKIAVSADLLWDDKGYSPVNMNQSGFVKNAFVRGYETNHDVLLNFSKKFVNDRLDVSAIAGVNVNERSSSNIGSTASNLAIASGFWTLSNGAEKTSMSDNKSKRRLVGLIGNATIGWDDMVYLDYSIRNDWSSTLPIDNNSYLYQGITGSFIFSKVIPENDILSFGKVRIAYGTTGNDADPYSTSDIFVSGYANAYYAADVYTFPNNGVNAYQKAATAGNNNLRPEMTKEFELGLDLQFFKGRIGVDASYYNRKTNDQVFTLPVDPASGYSYMIVNYGEVQNKGFELLLSTIPVQTKNFRWDLSFNFAKNHNEVLSLPEELKGGKTAINNFGSGKDALYMYAEVGRTTGELYTALPTYDSEGHIIVDETGLPVLTSEIQHTGKNVHPDWTGGINTAFSWKGLSLSASLDIRKGGYMFSRTKNLMFFTGNGAATTYNDRNPFIIPNSVVAVTGDDGKVSYVENTTAISYSDGTLQTFMDERGTFYGGENYLVDRSFVKLRNISLSYTLPRYISNMARLSDVTVGVFCSNVFTWTHKANRYIDPENTAYAMDGDLAAQFGELYCNPSCRIWGVNLGLKF